MKVLYITEYYPPFAKGGGEKSAKRLITAIRKKGVEVKVLHTNKFFNVTDWRRLIYFPIYSIIQVLRLQRKHSFDVIHCLNSTSIYAILVKWLIRRPFVMHINSYVTLCPKGTLIYRDQDIRMMCFFNCTLKNCFKCCKHSKLVGVKEMNITKKLSLLLWLRYQFQKYLLRKFDMLIPISKQTEGVLLDKGFKIEKITQVYYGS